MRGNRGLGWHGNGCRRGTLGRTSMKELDVEDCV